MAPPIFTLTGPGYDRLAPAGATKSPVDSNPTAGPDARVDHAGDQSKASDHEIRTLDDAGAHPANPYALADLAVGYRIDWKSAADPIKLLESILGYPRATLFGGRGPLFGGAQVALAAALAAPIARQAAVGKPVGSNADVDRVLAASGLRCADWLALPWDERARRAAAADVALSGRAAAILAVNVTSYCEAALEPGASRLSAADLLAAMHLDCAQWRRLAAPARPYWLAAARVPFNCGSLQRLDTACALRGGWSGPPNTTWAPLGVPYARTPSVLDPRQGAMGDCWLISMLAAAAWVAPALIANRSPWGGAPPASAGDRTAFDFVTTPCPDGVPRAPVRVETSWEVPVQECTYLPVYAHGAAGSTWPALYEKAYVQWTSGDDRPNIGAFYDILNDYYRRGVRCGPGSVELFGRATRRYDYTDTRARLLHPLPESVAHDAIFGAMAGGRARAIVTAGTVPPNIEGAYARSVDLYRLALARFGDIDIVCSHAYSVLGVLMRGTDVYVVLRNPWGAQPAIGSATLAGTWEGLAFGDDGVFALRWDAFTAFFTQLCVA